MDRKKTRQCCDCEATFFGSEVEAKREGWRRSGRVKKRHRCPDCRDRLILSNVNDELVRSMLEKLRNGVRV